MTNKIEINDIKNRIASKHKQKENNNISKKSKTTNIKCSTSKTYVEK